MRPAIQDAVLDIRDAGVSGMRLAGMTVLERQLFVLSRSGIRRAWICGADVSAAVRAGLRLPGDLNVRWNASEPPPMPHLVVSGEHLLRVDALQAMLVPEGRRLRFQDASQREVARIETAHDSTPASSARILPAGASVFLLEPSASSRALPWILDGVRKAGDGFMSRHFDRRLSLNITRRVLNIPVAPTHMTLLSIGMGLSGALEFLRSGPRHALFGAGLVWLHSVLDGCDGELARVTFQESRSGAFWDFWGDNAVHATLFLCLAERLSHDDPRAWAAGTLAAAGALGSAWIVSGNRNADPPPAETSGVAKTLRALEITLAQRDFIYLLVLAAIFQKIQWFLWAAGTGAPLYMLLAFCLRLKSGRPQPPM